MADQQPSIGRIVHYQSYGTPGGEFLPEPRAGIITGVHLDVDADNGGPIADVAVFNPTGVFFAVGLPFSEEPKPGHWSWPPRV